MTKKQFLEKIKEVTRCFYYIDKEKNMCWTRDHDFALRKNSPKSLAEVSLETDYFFEKWISGGISGGSCWDEGEPNYHSVAAEPEPGFTILDEVLTKICPQMSFIQYNKFISEIVQVGNYTVDEYYGNCSHYSYKFIKLQDIYEKLKEMKLV